MNRGWTIWGVGLAAALILGAATPGPVGAAGAGPAKVRYAAFVGMTGVGFWLGKEKGFYQQAGLDLDLVEVADKVSAYAAGEIDFADMSTTNAIVGAGRGAPFKVVASMYRTKGPFYLIARPGIKRVEELRGKRVGIFTFGSGMEAYVRVILKKHGLAPDRDTALIANGSHAQALASLEAGQVDATIIHEPFVSLAEKKGTGRLLARGWDYLPTFHTGVLTASTAFIGGQPELVRRLIAVYFKANTYAKEHPEELAEYAARFIKVDRETLRRALDRERVIWENKPELDLAALRDTQQIQVDLGFQKEIYDVKKILDPRFLPGTR